MDRIIDTRGSGKTGRLMLLAKENNGIIVCNNPYALQEKAYRYGFTGIDFISYNDFLTHEGKFDKPIYIDEVDGLLHHLAADSIKGYCLTIGD